MIHSSSDWHCPASALIPEAKKFIVEGISKGATMVGVGDLFDFLPIGKNKFKGCWAIEEMIDALDGYPFTYVGGNHDPPRWVKELFNKYPNIRVCKSFDIEEGGRKYRFTHGHQRSDWWLWRHIAPGWVEFAVDHFPRLWYWICKLFKWLPGETKERLKLKPSYKESEKLTLAYSVIQSAWMRYAEAEGITVVIGHTHKAYQGRRWSLEGALVGVLDGGNLPDGSLVEIDEKGGRIVWF